MESGGISEDARNEAAGGATAAEKTGDARKTRGIRFSESEWEEVKNAAAAHEMPAAEFVREKMLALARGTDRADSPAGVPSMAPLIERMFRYAWFLATERRDAMLHEGRGEELDRLVAEEQGVWMETTARRRRGTRESALKWSAVAGPSSCLSRLPVHCEG